MIAGRAFPDTPRRGLALILALVLLGLVGALSATLLRATATARLVADQAYRDAQVAWLVEAGLSRARARIAAAADYTGETWAVDASELGGRHGAKVLITVDPIEGQDGRVRVSARAEFPAGDDPTRAGKSRQVVMNAGRVPPGEQP
jgi:hypothetical protein